MVDRVTRFGVSLPGKLLREFDELASEIGYGNRSKAVADAVTEFLSQKKVSGDDRIVATISFIYDHHVPGVNKKLVKLQHDFEGGIKSVMHSHLSHDKCVEVLIVEGESAQVQKLFGGVGATRGVKNCKLSILKQL